MRRKITSMNKEIGKCSYKGKYRIPSSATNLPLKEEMKVSTYTHKKKESSRRWSDCDLIPPKRPFVDYHWRSSESSPFGDSDDP